MGHILRRTIYVLLLASLPVLPTAALAQQKTAKECNDEWTAQKAAIQASGKTKKEFIAECRGTAGSTAAGTAGAAPTAAAGGKTAKQCNDEWTAQKAAIQASGKTKKEFIAECRGTTGSTAAGTAGTAPAAAAGGKTAKQCNDEWTAQKAAIQASGKTKKQFIAECRGTAGSTAAGTAGAAPAAGGHQKTAKQCNDEWTAQKAAIQASGKTKKEFIAECRGTASSATAAAPGAGQGATKPNTAATTATTTAAAPAATGAALAAGQFRTEADAKARCGGDTVVWANLSSKIYHFSGNKSYGHTKSGAYMCEQNATGAGFRAAKNEKHP